MVNTTVRIDSIEIKNFKNVGYGHLDFEDSKKGGKASILGLYGQFRLILPTISTLTANMQHSNTALRSAIRKRIASIPFSTR